jgi:quercetin dioxygenase-like cupin family protein
MKFSQHGLIGLIRLIACAVLASAAPAFAQDVVKVSPATSKVLSENQYIRVVQSTFKPGAKEGMHTHPASWYYVTRPGKLKITYAGGKVELWAPKAGESAWMDGEEPHTAVNVGKTTLQYIMVEVKNAPTKTPN